MIPDASLVVDYLVDGGPRGEWAAERIRRARSLHVPHLFDLEVLAGLRAVAGRGHISGEQATIAARDLGDLPVERHAVHRLVDRIWALRGSVTPYDAAYLVLAEALELPLATTDRRLARSHGHRVEIVAFDV